MYTSTPVWTAVFIFLSISLSASSQQDPITVGGGVEIDFKSPKKYEIGGIRIDGVDNFDHSAIKLIAGLSQGQTIQIPGEKISKAIRNLWKEELFSGVEIFVEKEVAGVVYLVIKLKPRPKLSRFKFKGVNKREADKIREEITLFSGKTITENLVYSTNNKIKNYFKEKGYYSVEVKINRIVDTLINNSEIFLIDITKNQKIKIAKLHIIGNESIPTWKLKMAMKDTKQTAFWRFWKRSKYTTVSYERDKIAMMNKFNSIGLRDAMITSDTIFLRDKKSLVININIDEGLKYYFGNIDWIGNTKFRSSYLDTVLGIKDGDIYDKSLLDTRLNMSQDGRDISSLYMDRGYLFFQITPVETNVTNNHINFQMRLIEGKEARIKRIIIIRRNQSKTQTFRVYS